jgi:3-oxoacyl-[acyl-carrier-protein] synthase-3
VTLHLHGMGHFHPENEITNRFLEELDIGTTESWVLERVGIRARRTSLPLDYIRSTRNRDLGAGAEAAIYKNADLAKRASEMAISRAGVAPEQIGLVISGSNAPDVLCPAEACFVARELGLDVPAFDINSACASFIVQLQALSMMDPAKLPDFVLVVAVDCLTRSTDYSDRATAVLFGDAAAAAVVSPRAPGRARILQAVAHSSPAGADKVLVERTGHFRQDGRAVQMFAIKRTREGYEKVREAVAEAGGEDRALHFIGHQANLRVLEQVCQRCGIPPERHHANVELFGNTGAASAPSVLSMTWEKWGGADDVALVAVGGGLTWGRALVRFGGTS